MMTAAPRRVPVDFERGMRLAPPLILTLIVANVAVFVWELSAGALIGNMIVLYIVGIACEHAVGPAQTAFIYLAAGLSGSLLSMAMSPGPSVGASGAIFGVAAAVVVVLVRYQDRYHLRDKRISVVLGIWATYQLAIGFMMPFVDNFAHLGGLAGGALATLMVRSRVH